MWPLDGPILRKVEICCCSRETDFQSLPVNLSLFSFPMRWNSKDIIYLPLKMEIWQEHVQSADSGLGFWDQKIISSVARLICNLSHVTSAVSLGIGGVSGDVMLLHFHLLTVSQRVTESSSIFFLFLCYFFVFFFLEGTLLLRCSWLHVGDGPTFPLSSMFTPQESLSEAEVSVSLGGRDTASNQRADALLYDSLGTALTGWKCGYWSAAALRAELQLRRRGSLLLCLNSSPVCIWDHKTVLPDAAHPAESPDKYRLLKCCLSQHSVQLWRDSPWHFYCISSL